jgi:hypothetical protein
MKRLRSLVPVLAALSGLAASASATVIVDQTTWTTETRMLTSLPNRVGWFSNTSAGTLSVANGNLIGTISSSSSAIWVTHFTSAASPQTIAVGQALKVSLVFTPTDVSQNTNRGLRIGLFNFSNGTRANSDGLSTSGLGAGVTGYMLNANFSQTVGAGTVDAPQGALQIMERTSISSVSLMGTTSDFAVLGTGGIMTGEPAFQSNTQYTFEFTIVRNADSVDIITSFTDGLGFSTSHTVTDSTNFIDTFDTFAIRPANSAQVASSFIIDQFKVELVTAPIPEPSTYAAIVGVLGLSLAIWRRRRG